jgi:hypothetical protein
LSLAPSTNDFIALFKDSSIVMVITVVELTKQYQMLANASGRFIVLGLVTSGLYLAMSLPLALLARRFERSARSGSRMIRLRGIGKQFGGRVLFAGLDLDLVPGKTTVVMGRSGSGKSTLLRMSATNSNATTPAACACCRSRSRPGSPTANGNGALRRCDGAPAWCSRATTCSRTCVCSTT